MPKPGFLGDKREEIRQLIEDEQMTQAAVAARLGVHCTSIEKACRRWGLKTQRTGPRGGAGHPNWGGGRVLIGRYWHRWMPSHPHRTKRGYVAEHRLVMEAKLQRFLIPGEVVHHIDGDPQNNEVGNLMLFRSNAAHLKHELVGRVPAWTPEGRARILAAASKPAASRRKS